MLARLLVVFGAGRVGRVSVWSRPVVLRCWGGVGPGPVGEGRGVVGSSDAGVGLVRVEGVGGAAEPGEGDDEVGGERGGVRASCDPSRSMSVCRVADSALK